MQEKGQERLIYLHAQSIQTAPKARLQWNLSRRGNIPTLGAPPGGGGVPLMLAIVCM